MKTYFSSHIQNIMTEEENHSTYSSHVFHICEQPFPTERVLPHIRMKYDDFTDDEKNFFHLIINDMNSHARRGRWLTEPIELTNDFKQNSQIILTKIYVNDIPNINSPNYEYFFDLKMYDQDFEEELLIPFCYVRYIHHEDDNITFTVYSKDMFDPDWNYVSTCHILQHD